MSQMQTDSRRHCPTLGMDAAPLRQRPPLQQDTEKARDPGGIRSEADVMLGQRAVWECNCAVEPWVHVWGSSDSSEAKSWQEAARLRDGMREAGSRQAFLSHDTFFSQVTQKSLQFCALAVAISSSWVMAERARALPVPQTLANNILVTHLSLLIRRRIPQRECIQLALKAAS
ncbi:5-Azacytidine-Induced Protein 2 [Manis pentadactyla]|nr:5-Azacytidine-Induced Protein 2 [Manis pentadactyla]